MPFVACFVNPSKDIAMNRVVSQILSFSLIALAGVGIGWGGVTLIGRVNAGASVRKGDYSSVLNAAKSPFVLMSSSTCPYCRKAKAFLSSNRIPYVVFEIDQSKAAARLQERLKFDGVPVLLTNSSAIVGFDEKSYGNLVGKKTW